MSKLDNLPEHYPPNRKAWRTWLAKHHAQAQGVWVICYKKGSSMPTVSYDEIVEEALCYGWIDSKPQRVDDEKFKLLVTPRKPKSVWSAANKVRVEKLLAAGLITSAGQAKIDQAKANGAWDALNASDALLIAPDLATAFKRYKGSKDFFEVFPPSTKRALLEWINSAKTQATRAKRVEETASLAAQNIRANQWKPKDKAA
jgi:uncharacterized protein YdeI (YjbR/CyaY-like superfamily)